MRNFCKMASLTMRLGDNKGFTGVMIISPGLFDRDSATEFSLFDSTNIWNTFKMFDSARLMF